jgi:hypothetical protein
VFNINVLYLGKQHASLVNKTLLAPGQFPHNIIKDSESSGLNSGESFAHIIILHYLVTDY